MAKKDISQDTSAWRANILSNAKYLERATGNPEYCIVLEEIIKDINNLSEYIIKLDKT